MINEKIKNIYVWAISRGLKQISELPKEYQNVVKDEIENNKKDTLT